MDRSLGKLEPLTDEEMLDFKKAFTHNFDNMSAKEAVDFFRLVGDYEIFDDYCHDLLLRRLSMIIDCENYPERLI